MLLSYMLLTLATLLQQHANIAGQSTLPATLAQHMECTSIDIRNECNRMHLLDNCTVVTGYVMITLMPSQRLCDYTKYTFPLLREITDFMIFTEVRGLVSFRDMFPSLTVIRGRRLFLNYALGITNMMDLEKLEFPSLVAIQHGHVYIGTSPKLCQIERINWDRLTLSTGENHIIVGTSKCAERANCKGCLSGYCWSNFVCQRFENDNVVRYDQNSQHCHAQCLGGCSASSEADCRVCRGLSNDGVCVDNCPPDKFVMEQYQRCYTREQCISHHGHYTFGTECVAFCPSGYKPNASLHCVSCDRSEPCISVCSPESPNEAIVIYNLADAEELRGCQIVNGSLVITIRNQVHEQQLANSLSSLREIRGHLKIFRSSQLSSLQFLANLQRIHGDPLENRHYALILYDNRRLQELWTPTVQLEFVSGGMFMHRNNKLCNLHIRDFQTKVIHDKMMDSLQTSDQEVLCEPAKLELLVKVQSHSVVQLSWLKTQTSTELEIIYKPVVAGQLYPEQSELDEPVCTRISWQRRLLFPDELGDNGTHYSYMLADLQPNTRYVCLVRTFGEDYRRDARSVLTSVVTQADIPQLPRLELKRKTDSSIELEMAAASSTLPDYYQLSVYELPDNVAYVDARDYCKQSAYLYQDMDVGQWNQPTEDYDDCCAHQAEKNDDQRFIDEMRTQYSCSLDKPQNCGKQQQHEAAQQQLRLPGNTTSHVLHELKRYRLYALELQACNQLGCSSATTLSDRTNYTLGADMLAELTACQVPGKQEYVVRFHEPMQPNGAIVSYVIHFRDKVPPTVVVNSHVSCVTRREHAAANYVHVANLNASFNECAVRVHSLAGDVMTGFVQISKCEGPQELPTIKPTTWELQDVADTTEISPVSIVYSKTHGWHTSTFLICFLFGCCITIVWVMYKRRCWRKLPELRRYVPIRQQWLLERQQTDDREILVDGFETVRFQNSNSSHNNDTNEY